MGATIHRRALRGLGADVRLACRRSHRMGSGSTCHFVRRSFASSASASALTTSALSGAKKSKTLSALGTTAGLACFSVIASVLAWPVADLWLGPRLVREGLEIKHVPEVVRPLSPGIARVTHSLDAQLPAVLVLAGKCSAGKELEHACLVVGRPVIYLPLREGTSPHDFFFAITSGVYSSDRMGVVGIVTNSMGVWWTVLFDVIVGHSPNHTRSFHLSVVLQHMRRGLTAFTRRKSLSDLRPLIILDGFDEVGQALHATHKNADCHTAHIMLMKLLNWCCTVCFDDRMVDIAICTGPSKSALSRDLQTFTSSHELRKHLKPWLPC